MKNEVGLGHTATTGIEGNEFGVEISVVLMSARSGDVGMELLAFCDGFGVGKGL
jgi:hypothetical protein